MTKPAALRWAFLTWSHSSERKNNMDNVQSFYGLYSIKKHGLSNTLSFGVPQGSVLVPILYCLYTKPVSDIIRRFSWPHHSYADDTQIYITVKKQDCFADKLSDVEDCVSKIKLWMERNMLKLNDDNTELIVFKSNRNVETFAGGSIHVGCTAIEISVKKDWSYT